MITIGETATKSLTLDREQIRTFAASCGDFNPLHHDEAFAKASRFGGIIACGPHYVALLMGLLATHYTQHGPQVGIGFDAMKLEKPVRPGDTIELKWVVRAIEPRSIGDVVTLDGSITNQDGARVLSVIGKIMAFRT
ncbi:MAG: MaoC family dehydratase [Burkholderiales bacterium]|nr:MaoC family dehydratase [Burkholderiales bacterium]